VVCSLTRCAATLGDLEGFFDRWIPAAAGGVVRGYNDYCGVLPSDPLLPMEPLVREGCRRLDRRMVLLADGRAVLCGQDVGGATAFGSWVSGSLADLWRGPALGAARECHSQLTLDDYPLCVRCQEWFRP
jgi:hypothetical protein